METCSPANSNSTFCPEFEYAASQTNLQFVKPKKKTRNLKISQDIGQLQQETLACLKSYRTRKHSFNIKELENKKDEILSVIKCEKKLSKISLNAFERKLSEIEEAIEERRRNDIHPSKRINKINRENSKENNLTSQTSILLLEKNQSEIVIQDTSPIITEFTEKETNEPLNLCIKNPVDSQRNDGLLDVDLNTSEAELYNPIDLSLKINCKEKNLNKNNNGITNNKIEIIPSIFKNSKKVNNFSLADNKKHVNKISQNRQQITDINQKNNRNNTIPNYLENNQISTKKLSDLSEAELEAIKEELKAKIIQFFAENLNEENIIQHNSVKCADELQSYDNNTNEGKVKISHNYNKENIKIVETQNDFENLWSQSFECPSNTQPIEYNDLQEAVDYQNVYKSDGTDTNHIDIDKISDIPNIDTKSHDLNSISCFNYFPKIIERDQETVTYTLSEKHILRLATALNLNIDYLKLQLRLCMMEYSRNNYDFDDISVIAPSQSPININKMRKLNRISSKIYNNLNVSKIVSHFDISRNSNYHNYRKTERRMMKKRSKHCPDETFNLYSNFAKR